MDENVKGILKSVFKKAVKELDKRGSIDLSFLTGDTAEDSAGAESELPASGMFGDFRYETEGYGCVLAEYKGSDRIVSVPGQMNGKEVQIIGASAFVRNQTMEEIILPDTVLEIRNRAFSSCPNLSRVQLGNRVVKLGSEIFFDSPQITSLVLPDSIQEMGSNAVYAEMLEEVNIPAGLKVIAPYAFTCTSLEKVVIPSTVGEVSEGAFSHCEQLREVVIQEGVRIIGDNAFGEGGSLVRAVVPGSVTQISPGAFLDAAEGFVIETPSGSTAEEVFGQLGYQIVPI